MGKQESKSSKTKSSMKVKDMKVSDVINSEEYRSYIGKLVKELTNERKSARQAHGKRLKAHVIDRLIEKQQFSVEALMENVPQVLNKTANGLSRAERDFILSCHTEAYVRTMKKLIENDEEAKEILKCKTEVSK